MELVQTLFRSRRRLLLRLAIYFFFFAITIDLILTTYSLSSSTRLPPTIPVYDASAKQEKIFIASLHWNGAELIRDHWAPAILDLVRHYGSENVYISLVAGGSFDDAETALREFDAELEHMRVQRSIVIKNITHEDEVRRMPANGEEGWVWTPREKFELRRIPYLAGLRNEVMSKLYDLAEKKSGRMVFDKVVWLNDVIFTVQDVVTLIGTRDGDYSTVCALDFSDPPLYYDTFALRDSEGDRPISMTWPYFLSSASRDAMIANTAVPVVSCWNGLVIFQADNFYRPNRTVFRGIPDSLAAYHLEGSECCLINTDIARGLWWRGVWVNPNVRVSYNAMSDRIVRTASGVWPGRFMRVIGIWKIRWASLAGGPRRALAKQAVRLRVKKWEMQAPKGEKRIEFGESCIVDEMQVLVYNGWKHV